MMSDKKRHVSSAGIKAIIINLVRFRLSVSDGHRWVFLLHV